MLYAHTILEIKKVLPIIRLKLSNFLFGCKSTIFSPEVPAALKWKTIFTTSFLKLLIQFPFSNFWGNFNYFLL